MTKWYYGITPLIATKWYLDKMKQELTLVQKRAVWIKGFDFPTGFLKRHIEDMIASCIRNVQYLYFRNKSCQRMIYREECFLNNGICRKSTAYGKVYVEHVIPVAHSQKIISALIKNWQMDDCELNKTIVKAFLSPVALILKESESKIEKAQRNSNDTPNIPFKRYNNTWINIFTCEWKRIDNNHWSIEDHRALLRRMPDFKEIMEEFGI